MTRKEWLQKAIETAPKLRSLLGNHHPSSAAHAKNSGKFKERITAAAAEEKCEEIRQQIREEEAAVNLEHPIARFDAALQREDIDEIASLLEGAWVGVPESTECWGIRGFREAVDL